LSRDTTSSSWGWDVGAGSATELELVVSIVMTRLRE
jgi:hypothetical protein